MNAEQLKASILQQAIEGKLVSQLASEKGVKQIGEALKDVLFPIPEKWQWLQLKHVCTKFLVPMRDKPSFSDNPKDIPWCRIEDIEGMYIRGSKSNRFLSQEVIESMSLKVNPVGTVISACSASIGAAAIVQNPLCTNQTFIGLVCNDKLLINKYLFYFLKASIKRLIKIGAGTTIKYISRKKYEDFYIPIPPLEEQKRIVAKIEELLPLVEAYGKSYDRLQELNAELPGKLKASILQEAIQGKLVPQLDSEEEVQQIGDAPEDVPFAVPKKWKWEKLLDIAKVMGGKRVPAGDKLVEDNTGFPYIRVSDMKNGGVDMSGVLYLTKECREKIKRYTISSKDIYVTVAGTIGRVGVIPEELDGANLTENADKIVLTTERVIRDWILLVFLSEYCQNLFKAKKTKVGQPKLAIKRIESILIPIPPVQEQLRIITKVKELLNQVDDMSDT